MTHFQGRYFTLALAGLIALGCNQVHRLNLTNRGPSHPERPPEGPTKEINSGAKAPIRRSSKANSDALAKALASKDDRKILAAVTKALTLDPQRPDLREIQARLLAESGKKHEAKEAYALILWPKVGSESNLSTNIGVIERFIALCEQTRDRRMLEMGLQRARSVLKENSRYLPAKELSSASEMRAAISYQAYYEALNYERNDEAMRLIERAAKLDPEVAAYHIRHAQELLKAGLYWIRRTEDLSIPVARWKAGLVAVSRGRKAAILSDSDRQKLDSEEYDLQNYIDMAKGGFFKGAAKAFKKSGGAITYQVVTPPKPKSGGQ